MGDGETKRQLVERQIALGRKHIARQLEIIQALRSQGYPTGGSERQLTELEQLQRCTKSISNGFEIRTEDSTCFLQRAVWHRSANRHAPCWRQRAFSFVLELICVHQTGAGFGISGYVASTAFEKPAGSPPRSSGFSLQSGLSNSGYAGRLWRAVRRPAFSSTDDGRLATTGLWFDQNPWRHRPRRSG